MQPGPRPQVSGTADLHAWRSRISQGRSILPLLSLQLADGGLTRWHFTPPRRLSPLLSSAKIVWCEFWARLVAEFEPGIKEGADVDPGARYFWTRLPNRFQSRVF